MSSSAIPTTIRDEIETQTAIQKCFTLESKLPSILLYRKAHIAFLIRVLDRPLSSHYAALYASLPWICFWTVHALDLLDYQLSPNQQQKVIATLAACQHPTGGFGGGPGQLAHLACTYAAVATLAIVGTNEAYQVINKSVLMEFLRRMKQVDGSFRVHEDGEMDVRGAYCALAVAALLNDNSFKKDQSIANWLQSCISYEGGWGAVPGAEAHTGYTYCGLAASSLLGMMDTVLKGEIATRTSNYLEYMQDRMNLVNELEAIPRSSGGMRGRTHKLVDGCYSFWGAASLFLFQNHYQTNIPFDSIALQRYILLAAQDLELYNKSDEDDNHSHGDDDDDDNNYNFDRYDFESITLGGLRDKPGKVPDLYHTCYCLSGLAIAQSINPDHIFGNPINRLPEILPEYNLKSNQVDSMQNYFTHNP